MAIIEDFKNAAKMLNEADSYVAKGAAAELMQKLADTICKWDQDPFDNHYVTREYVIEVDLAPKNKVYRITPDVGWLSTKAILTEVRQHGIPAKKDRKK